jgi:hypothetical protein
MLNIQKRMEVIAADHEIEIKKNTQEKMMEKLEEGAKYVVELCSREVQSGVDSVTSTQ